MKNSILLALLVSIVFSCGEKPSEKDDYLYNIQSILNGNAFVSENGQIGTTTTMKFHDFDHYVTDDGQAGLIGHAIMKVGNHSNQEYNESVHDATLIITAGRALNSNDFVASITSDHPILLHNTTLEVVSDEAITMGSTTYRRKL